MQFTKGDVPAVTFLSYRQVKNNRDLHLERIQSRFLSRHNGWSIPRRKSFKVPDERKRHRRTMTTKKGNSTFKVVP